MSVLALSSLWEITTKKLVEFWASPLRGDNKTKLSLKIDTPSWVITNCTRLSNSWAFQPSFPHLLSGDNNTTPSFNFCLLSMCYMPLGNPHLLASAIGKLCVCVCLFSAHTDNYLSGLRRFTINLWAPFFYFQSHFGTGVREPSLFTSKYNAFKFSLLL